MKRKAYAKYKDSGVEWLGQVPEHWEVRRLKFDVTKVGSGVTPKGGANSYQSSGIPLLRSQNIHFDGLRLDDVAYISEDVHAEMSNSQVQSGDVLLNITGGSIGRCYFVTDELGEANVNQHVCIIRPEASLHTKFLNYVMSSNLGQAQIDIEQSGSGREGLNFEVIKQFWIPKIDYSEQSAIAAFLDQKTAQIDALIQKKKELIAKLGEQRIALITQAVTKGLNPKVKLKDSGVEWLGQVPEHWEVRRIKDFTTIRYGLGEPPEYRDEGLLFVRATDVFRGKIVIEGMKKISPDDVPWNRNPSLKTGEIIVVRSGAYTGDSAIIPPELEGAIAGFDMVMNVCDGDAKFVSYALLSRYLLDAQIILARTRAAQPHLNSEELGGFIFIYPPHAEQSAIAAFLDQKTAQIDALVRKAEEAVAKLEEYRMAVITAAVTGKVDVRR